MATTKKGDEVLNKANYIGRFKELYWQKNNAELSDEKALEYFEQLVALVATITSHMPVNEIVIPKSTREQDSQFDSEAVQL